MSSCARSTQSQMGHTRMDGSVCGAHYILLPVVLYSVVNPPFCCCFILGKEEWDMYRLYLLDLSLWGSHRSAQLCHQNWKEVLWYQLRTSSAASSVAVREEGALCLWSSSLNIYLTNNNQNMFRQSSSLVARRLLQRQHQSTTSTGSSRLLQQQTHHQQSRNIAIRSLSTTITTSWNQSPHSTTGKSTATHRNKSTTAKCIMGDAISFPNRPFTKIMAANRGEIATRIMRAGTELGCGTVGIYSHEGTSYICSM